MSRVVVVGGGVAGLTTAFRLRTLNPDNPPEVVVLEGDSRAGGRIQTDRDDGCIREWGPNGFLDNVPAMLDLVDDLDLRGKLRPSREAAANRYLFKGKGLWKLPGSQVEFMASGLLPFFAKLRILWEPFAAKRPEGDESVLDFASRRIGREAARTLVDPMVGGVFAGDAKTLSLRSAFPKMYSMESDYGGLIRAMRAKKKAAAASGTKGGSPFGPGGSLHSFDGGMQTLTDALAERLGDAVRREKRCMSVRREGEQWVIQAADGEMFRADEVVLALPAPEAALAVRGLDAELAGIMDSIPVEPVVVVSLRYAAEDAPMAKEGFGFLVPSWERARVLGVLWDSTIFDGRCPDGDVLVRAMAGGARAPDRASLPDDELLALVREDLKMTMRIEAEPKDVRIYRHRLGIAQYTIGHGDRLDALDARLAGHPGLHVAGASYRGVSTNLCVENAGKTAAHILERCSP